MPGSEQASTASSLCRECLGKRPGGSGVRRCLLLPILLSVGRDRSRGACHRHRSSQRFSALWRHLPGQEYAEVCRALTAMVRTGLEEGVKPMVWIETPQQDGLDHTQHHRSQVGAPHAARAIIVLTAYHWVAQDALRGVIVHGHFWTPHKDREPIPVVVQATQNLVFGQMERGLLQMRLAARLHLAQFRFQLAVALDKGRRLLRERHRLVPHLKTGLIEAVEYADIVNPGEHPVLELQPTARRFEKIPTYMRPAKSQEQSVAVLGQAFVGTVTVTHQHHLDQVMV